MPTITLCLDQNKKLSGVTLRDQRAYTAFKFKIQNLGDESISFSYRSPRSGPFHRRFFKIISELFDAQDAFKDFDMFRTWLEVGAAYCEYFPDQNGEMIAVPKSIAYDKLDQVEFKEVTDRIMEFVRSEHARRFLWQHMDDGVSAQMVDALLGQFEK